MITKESEMAELRNLKLDGVKAAIAAAAVGGVHEGNDIQDWAVRRWGTANAPRQLVRAAVGSVTTADLGGPSSVDAALFEAVRERAALFRIRPRRLAFQTRTITAGGTAGAEVEAAKAFPILSPTFGGGQLARRKFVSATVATKEAIDAQPGLESLIFADLSGGIAGALDFAFLDPSAPGSVTSGTPSISATGDLAADLETLVAAFGGDLSRARFVMPPRIAVAIAAAGIDRDLGARGGDLFGVPVETTRGAPAGQVTLIDGAGIAAAWDAEAYLASSTAGTIQMDDAPTNGSDTPTETSLVSLFQTNSVCFRALAYANWLRAREDSVAVLTGLGGGSSS